MSTTKAADRAARAATRHAGARVQLVFAGAFAALLALGLPFAAKAQQPIVIKFSHVTTSDTPKGKGAEKFAPLGAKEFEALDLPFLFANDDEYTRISKGPVGQWLFQKLVPKGITGLAFWDNGFHMVSANRPLIAPADFQGLKFRISGSNIADQYFRLMGGLPQILAFSEVYQALQTGVVDGCENTPSNYLTQKFYEVQKHVSAANHAHLQYAVIVNTKFWTGLPADIRGQLDQAMNEATDYTNSIARKENEDAMAAIEGSGKTTIHVLTEPQRQAWKTKMMPAYDWAKGRVGKEVLDLLSKAMDTKTN